MVMISVLQHNFSYCCCDSQRLSRSTRCHFYVPFGSVMVHLGQKYYALEGELPTDIAVPVAVVTQMQFKASFYYWGFVRVSPERLSTFSWDRLLFVLIDTNTVISVQHTIAKTFVCAVPFRCYGQLCSLHLSCVLLVCDQCTAWQTHTPSSPVKRINCKYTFFAMLFRF